MLDHSFAISELNRKLANVVRIGIVKEIDYEKAKAKVKIGEIVTDFLPWITSRAGEERSWLPPSI
ncbi:phage baseplate assembly protein V, partial [Wolbachia endosymbiont of Drosophila barbarae]|uniref:phage baseplate assembly protein V n=1 Tax=Wolbachia endosymbiont of Drosophila barbarae TaxID=3377043 RepID=UPI0037F5C703